MFDTKLESARKILRILFILAVICAAGAAVLYVLAFNAEYDTALHHYAADGILIKLASAALVVCAAAALAVYFMTKGKAAVGDTVSQAETFGVILTAFMFIAFGIVSFGDHSIDPVNGFAAFCIKATPFLALLSSIPFICAASERLRGTTLHRVTSVFPVLCGTALIFKYYFDIQVVPLNDPEITLTLVPISAWVLFMLFEARLANGIAEPRHAGAAAIVGLIPGVIGAGRIILYYKSGASPITTVMEDVMFAAIAVLALCRLVSLTGRLESAPEPDPEKDGKKKKKEEKSSDEPSESAE